MVFSKKKSGEGVPEVEVIAVGEGNDLVTEIIVVISQDKTEEDEERNNSSVIC